MSSRWGQLGSDWQSYPSATAGNIPLGCDTELLAIRLAEDRERLFSSEAEDHVKCLRIAESGEFQSHLIEGAGGLSALWRGPENVDGDLFYLIRQRNSWSRLLVSHQTVCRILAFHIVFPQFLDVLHAFGKRTREDRFMWNYFRWSTSAEMKRHEVCYNMRYFERNDRTQGDPWSLRQTGIYQCVDLATQHATWILLQPSQSMTTRLNNRLQCLSGRSQPHRDYIGLHLVLLCSCLRTWREYIAALEAELHELDEKACFSRLDCHFKHDYRLTFSDCQQMQLLRGKLLRASAVLDSLARIGESCKDYDRVLNTTSGSDASKVTPEELTAYLSEIRYYRHALSRLLERSAGTTTLLSTILEYRNDKSINESSQATRETLDVMKGLALQAELDTKLAKKDSRALKSLTIIATMYIPASLLATIFSSNLVQLQENGPGVTASTHYQVASEFWKFVVIMISMIVVTFMLVWILQRTWEQEARPQAAV